MNIVIFIITIVILHQLVDWRVLRGVIQRFIETLCHYNTADMLCGVFDVEFLDLQKELGKHFAALSVPKTFVNNDGWQILQFRICMNSAYLPEDLKPILVIEVRNFIQMRRGIENNCIYCPIFTAEVLNIAIACSPKAQDEFLKLQFHHPTAEYGPIVEEKANID